MQHYSLALLFLFIGYTAQSQSLKINESAHQDSISENYTHTTPSEDAHQLKNFLKAEQQKNAIKVWYEDALYSLKKFEREVGFNNQLKKVDIIKDREAMPEKFQSDSLQVLIITEFIQENIVILIYFVIFT